MNAWLHWLNRLRTPRNRVRRSTRLTLEALEDRALPAGTGLTAAYFDNADFSTPKLTRTDAAVDFDWGAGAPASAVGADTFSVRWSGAVQPRFSETYTFFLDADDGARLWVDNQVVVDRMSYAADATESAGTIALLAGEQYDIRLEYVENTGAAHVRLEWSSPSQAREVIPGSQLYPTTRADDRGSILAETWTGIPGTSVASLTGSSNYPNRPSGREYLTSFESLLANAGNDYGTRVRGYLYPATTGTYVLAVAGDNETQLYLSTDADPANAVLVAGSATATGIREWDRFPGQRSVSIDLVAGQAYYIELRHKEGTGSDHFAVGWQTPGSTETVVIPGDYLSPVGTDLAVPPQGSILATLAQGRPRLLSTPQRFALTKQQIATDPQLAKWYQIVVDQANAMLTAPVSTYEPDEQGNILSVSRTVLDRVSTLAFVYRISGAAQYAERAWKELSAAAAFPDWHPAHFLDTAEMTRAFAIGYDWLYDYWTAGRRSTIRTALINKGLKPGLAEYKNNAGWTRETSNNWNLVCNGGMVMGALALGDEGSALAEEILSRALASVRPVMRHFTTDNGGWYEGPGYWDYATDYNVQMLAALETALGSDFGLGRIPGVSEIGAYALYADSPTQLSFNHGDAWPDSRYGPQMFWYARRYNRPEYASYERANAIPKPLDLLWYDPRGADPASAGLAPDAYFRGPTNTNPYLGSEVVTMRTGWEDPNATFVGFKAGQVDYSHGDLDAGSFVVDAMAKRWAWELGADSFALPGYFGSERYTYYRTRAEGQNTLVINPGAGPDQNTAANTEIVIFNTEASADRTSVVADLTPAYSGVTSVWRGVSLFDDRRQVLVQDEIKATTPADVWWFMHVKLTLSQIQVSPDGTSVMLTDGEERLWLKIVSGGGTFTVMDALPLPTSPNPAGQADNSAYKKLAIHLTGVTNTRLAVWMVPLAPAEGPPTVPPTLAPLAEWGKIVNDAPLATNAKVLTPADTPVDVDLRTLVQDQETPTAGLRFTVGAATNGTVVLLADGHTARFTPAAGYNGAAGFTYWVTDTWADPRLLFAYSMEPPTATDSGRVTDSSGRGRDGTLKVIGAGGASYATATPSALGGFSTRSLDLTENGNGNGARLSRAVAPAELNFNTADWTFSGWFKRRDTATDDFIFYLGNGDGFGGNNELAVYAPAGQTSVVLRHDPGPDVRIVKTGVAADEWHHVAVTYHAGTLRFYVDGTLVGSDNTFTLALSQTFPVVFGGHNSLTSQTRRWFDGSLDDMAVFAAALTDAEVAELASRTVAHFGGTTVAGAVNVVAGGTTTTQAAVADAYVRGGAYGSQNFGTASVLTVKNDDGPDFTREAFLRFDLSGVTGTVLHAVLRLVPTSVGQPGIEHAIALVPDDTWGENTITWNNRPASLEVAFARWTVQAGQPVELDITSLVQQAQAGDGKLSLRIFSTRNVGNSGLVNYGSRQGSAANRPQLVLITAD